MLKFWLQTLCFGALVFASASFYLFLRAGNYNLFLANKALAAAAVILIGLSFALSGITYFTPFFHSRLAYRKELGVIGFFGGLGHGLLSSLKLFPFPQFFLNNPFPFIFAVLTIILFTIMTVVSNFNIPQKIGAQNWRRILRLGYAGIVFLMIHFGMLSFGDWKLWFLTLKPILPPLSLLLFIFSSFVLLLRLALFISLRKKNSKPINSEA